MHQSPITVLLTVLTKQSQVFEGEDVLSLNDGLSGSTLPKCFFFQPETLKSHANHDGSYSHTSQN